METRGNRLNLSIMTKIVLRRKSKRSFSKREVDPRLLRRILSLARYAPSAHNHQPWKVIVTNPKIMSAALFPGNRWALASDKIVAVIASPTDDALVNGTHYYLLDCGIFADHFMLLCTSAGLRVHPMAGFWEADVRRILDIPKNYKVVLLVAVGWPGRTDKLDSESRKKDLRRRVRKEIDEFVSWERWPSSTSGEHPKDLVYEYG